MQCANVAPSAIDGKCGGSEEVELQAALRVVPGSEIDACYGSLCASFRSSQFGQFGSARCRQTKACWFQ
jgi:hypothetical protein